VINDSCPPGSWTPILPGRDKPLRSAYTLIRSRLQRIVVVTIRHSVVLGSVLCASMAGTLARGQDNADLMAALLTQSNPDHKALANHRLTALNLRQTFAVDRELLKLMKETPDWEERAGAFEKRIDPQRRGGMVTVGATIYEGIPETKAILQRNGISGREYMLTSMVAMVTQMADETLSREAGGGGVNEIPKELMTPALKFWRSMDPALKAEADEWKNVREEMARAGRSR
jgi:hypothetical protein